MKSPLVGPRVTAVSLTLFLAQVMLIGSSASGGYYLDRWYRMGDDSAEGAVGGQPVGSGNSFGWTFDSAGASGQNNLQDLAPNGSPTYVDISGDKPFPDSTLDNRAILFNGTQYLSGQYLNRPSDADAVTMQAEDYTGITDRGYQMWVKPSVGSTGADQSLLDDADIHRAYIGPNGDHGFEIRTTVNTSPPPATAGAWTHIAQVRPNGNFGGSVGYVNGRVIVSQTGDYPSATIGVNSVVISANIESDGLGGQTITPQFSGLVSDVEMFVMGGSFGAYNYATDNGYFTDVFLPTTSGYGYADADQDGHNDSVWINGDINFDGALNATDITTFITGWRSTNVGTYAGAGPGFGDYVTLGDGDLDLDGDTDVDDWAALRATGIVALSDLSALSGQSVPEPSAGLLSLVVAGSALCRRQRPRSVETH